MNESTYKYLGLLLLTIQQASMPLMARYSRYRDESEIFFTTVNVFVMEVIKLIVCSIIMIYTVKSLGKFVKDLKVAVYDNPTETLKVCVPALIYTVQNNLYYIALTHLEATTFCIAYQMKIFTTAILMYFLLGKRLSSKQWTALLILVIGVIDVQLVYSPPTSKSGVEQNPVLGFVCVVVMCFTSAFAGVYLEKVLKESTTSVWMQNIRIALIGLPISFMSMWYYDWENIQQYGAFRGWDLLVICLTVTNSVGGLLISIVIKYADNILKAYAQSMAIIGAAIGSWLLFDFTPGFFFIAGSALVSNLISDICISGIVQPVPFYPYCAVSVLGPIKYILPYPLIGLSLIFSLVILSVSFSIGILFYRYQTIKCGKRLFNNESHLLISIAFICCGLALNFIFALYVGEVPFEERKKAFLPVHPSFESFFSNENAFADNWLPNFSYLMLSLCCTEAILIFSGCFSIYGCIKCLDEHKSTISERTRKNQRAFTIRLLIQFVIPLMFIGIPSTYIISVMVFEYCTQWTWIFNIATYFAISIHSIIFAITTILITDHYRRSIFAIRKRKVNCSTIQTLSVRK